MASAKWSNPRDCWALTNYSPIGFAGELSGAKFAFLATERDLGVIVEVFSFSGTPDEEAP
jgi:hypothetical protein